MDNQKTKRESITKWLRTDRRVRTAARCHEWVHHRAESLVSSITQSSQLPADTFCLRVDTSSAPVHKVWIVCVWRIATYDLPLKTGPVVRRHSCVFGALRSINRELLGTAQAAQTYGVSAAEICVVRCSTVPVLYRWSEKTHQYEIVLYARFFR